MNPFQRTVILVSALALSLLFLSAASIVLCAQSSQEMPRLFGIFNPELGAWSEYSVVDKNSGRQSKMRMAIVGEEGSSFWYEVLTDDGENRNIVKMLVKGSPNDPDNIQRMIMKSGDAPATEMAKDFVAMGRKMAAYMFERRSGVPVDGCGALRLETGGHRQVVVPAGTFHATQKKIVDGQGNVLATYDFEPAVLPLGILTSDTQQSKMELLAYGTDAKSLITETPIPLSGPPRMPPNMPQGMPPGMKRPASQP